MHMLLLALSSGCGTDQPRESRGDSADWNMPLDDTGTGNTDDSAIPECTPVEYYLDADHDGYGAGDVLSDCDPVDASDVDGDCDDADPAVHPDQKDGCNGIDDDCDLDFDEDGGATIPYYWDGDGDGYGTDAKAIESCGDVPEGFVA